MTSAKMTSGQPATPPLNMPVKEPDVPTKAAPKLLEIIEGAKQQFKSIVHYPIDSVTGVQKSADGWHLLVTLIELSRIPSASDVLAEYAVDLDNAGEIVSYKQVQRFFRNQVGIDDGA